MLFSSSESINFLFLHLVIIETVLLTIAQLPVWSPASADSRASCVREPVKFDSSDQSKLAPRGATKAQYYRDYLSKKVSIGIWAHILHQI